MRNEKTNLVFVDDDVSILAGLRRLMRRFKAQWNMRFFANAIDAIEHLEKERVDVLVSDVRMPELDGVELMEFVSLNYPGTIRIILSGQSESEQAIQLAESVHQYFAKPCNATNLFETISLIRTRQKTIRNSNWLPHLTGLSSIPCTSKHHVVFESGTLEMDRFLETVDGDISFKAKILQLASSSFFGETNQSCNVDEACKALGTGLLTAVLGKMNTLDTIKTKTIKTNRSFSTIEEIYREVNLRLAVYLASQNEFAANSIQETMKQLNENGNSAARYLFALWGIKPTSFIQNANGNEEPCALQVPSILS